MVNNAVNYYSAEFPPYGKLVDNFYAGTKTPLNGLDTMKLVRERTSGTCLVSFSSGKDSIATYLALKESGLWDDIIIYQMIQTDLEFVERRIQYYEKAFDTHIYRLTDPHLFRFYRNFIYQSPMGAMLLFSGLRGVLETEWYDYDAVCIHLADYLDLPDEVAVAVGVRAIDSMKRRANFAVSGAVNWKRYPPVFYPIWDMSHTDAAALIRRHGVKLPMDYKYWGTSWDGTSYEFLRVIKERYPNDYNTLLEHFPLLEANLFRYDVVGKSAQKWIIDKARNKTGVKHGN